MTRCVRSSALTPIVKEGLRTAINSRTLQELVSGGRADVTQHLAAEANRATQGLGIEVVDLRIKRIDLPEDGTVIGSVYERMRSERKQVAEPAARRRPGSGQDDQGRRRSPGRR